MCEHVVDVTVKTALTYLFHPKKKISFIFTILGPFQPYILQQPATPVPVSH